MPHDHSISRQSARLMVSWFWLALLAVAPFAGSAHAAVIADLSGDWSDSSNPNTRNANGVWEYRAGSGDLPSVPAFTFAAPPGPGEIDQNAWAPSNAAGNFLPAEMKATSATAALLGPDPNTPSSPNVLTGDVLMHTQDPANGPLSGIGNYRFTLTNPAAAGLVEIKGFVWNANLVFGTSRPENWALIVNGTKVASGGLSGTVSRSQAQTFDLSQTLAVGSTVELDLTDVTLGQLVGAGLTLSSSGPANAGSAGGDVPLPLWSWFMLGAGLLTLMWLSRRPSRL